MRSTVRLNVTDGVSVGALLDDPRRRGRRAVEVATSTRVRGRVIALGGSVVRRRAVLKMNCTVTVAVDDMSIRGTRAASNSSGCETALVGSYTPVTNSAGLPRCR